MRPLMQSTGLRYDYISSSTTRGDYLRLVAARLLPEDLFWYMNRLHGRTTMLRPGSFGR